MRRCHRHPRSSNVPTGGCTVGCSTSGATVRERAVGRRPAGGLHAVFSSNFSVSGGSDSKRILRAIADEDASYRCLERTHLACQSPNGANTRSTGACPLSRFTIAGRIALRGQSRIGGNVNRHDLDSETLKTLALVGALSAALVVSACTAPATSSQPAAGSPTSSSGELTSQEDDGGSSGDDPIGSGELTTAQREAAETALNYLNTIAFSRSGLIDQLEFEGYSKNDATLAVDSLTVDWREQAALKAESYLDTGSFSESGLVDQLEFEGFTRAQAEYGAKSVFGGGGANDDNSNSGGGGVSLQNAIEAAENYLRVAPFSESGLIAQLEYEGYSNSDARAAVGSLNVDWDEQAAKAARNYLDLMPFSRSELIDQLEFEGYTSSQAAYGASRAGL